MANKFEYTTLAHRYTARFPLLTYVGTQANFWILANLLLVTIMSLHSRIISQAFHIPLARGFGAMLWMALLLGVVYGVSLGLLGYYLDRKVFRKASLGKIILF